MPKCVYISVQRMTFEGKMCSSEKNILYNEKIMNSAKGVPLMTLMLKSI